MVRTEESVVFKRPIKKCESNIVVRKECEHSQRFFKKNIESLRVAKELIEDVLGDICFKDVPFSMLQPATEDDIRSLGQASGELDERFPNMDGMNNAKKSTEVQDFFQKHCTSRTYFFQVKNCNDLDCLNDKPMCSDSSIDGFLDPVSIEVDCVLHY